MILTFPCKSKYPHITCSKIQTYLIYNDIKKKKKRYNFLSSESNYILSQNISWLIIIKKKSTDLSI